MKHYVLIIDESSENAELLSRFLPSKYELISIVPNEDSIDIRNLKDKEIVFINMDKKKSLYLTLYYTIRNKYLDCKIVWMTNNSGSALTAFEEHADAFMLLPISKERVTEVFKRLLRTS